jgi:two-component system cell cycle sensor histidine kinase/response regulator CckA
MAVGGASGSRVDGDVRLVIVESPDLAAPLVDALDVADIGAWMWVEAENALYFSPRMLELLDLDRDGDRPLLSRFLSAIHPDDREPVRRLIDRELPEGPFELRHRAARRDGTFRWIGNRGRVERARDGSLVRQGGVMRDVTRHVLQEQERARAEQALQEAQKLESLGILAGGIAHDFNNLLTAILGNATLLRAEFPEEALLQTPLEQIELASRRAADLCRQMLAYAGKGRFALQAIDLNDVVRASHPLIRASVPKKAVLDLKLLDALPAVLGDQAQLRQLLMNLAINAGEALREGEGTITIATGCRAVTSRELAATVFTTVLQEGRYVSLTVSDTGTGMPRDMISRIFDPFFTTRFTGRGLGLPAVLGIVRAHDGAMRVDSTPGVGSTFELLLRAATEGTETNATETTEATETNATETTEGTETNATETTEATEMPDEATLARWRTTGTALVVDDERGVRDLLRSILQRVGFQVVVAENGPDGVEKLRAIAGTVRLALIDLTMPGMNGLEALAEMRRIQPDLRAVLMSGYASSAVADADSHGFLQKPLTPYTVREAVWKALTPDR